MAGTPSVPVRSRYDLRIGTHLFSFAAAISFLILLSGCSNEYKPSSPWEQRVYSQSRRDLFPDQVRSDPAAYGNTLVAWTGILVSSEIHRGDQPCVDLLVEHRFFDWIEDHGTQRQLFYLSPRGQGLFRASWPLKKEWDLDAMAKLIRPGDMMVVYGKPQSNAGGVVDLGQAEYVREIPKQYFADDVLDYAPGQPTRTLRTPVFK